MVGIYSGFAGSTVLLGCRRSCCAPCYALLPHLLKLLIIAVTLVLHHLHWDTHPSGVALLVLLLGGCGGSV
jgi:hypothetical protein